MSDYKIEWHKGGGGWWTIFRREKSGKWLDVASADTLTEAQAIMIDLNPTVSKLASEPTLKFCGTFLCGVCYDCLCHNIGFMDSRIIRLEKILEAYREKRKWDGGEGRVWNASKHLDADDLITKLENETK